jgi:SAM-dependent methyltransferase
MFDHDQLASAYARHRKLHPEVFRRLASSVGAASRVLEVGCGTGNYIRALADQAGCPCWGIDPSREMIARARDYPGQVQFQEGRAEHLEFPPESFELVFSVDVIHHVEDPDRYLAEAYRVLSPGGKVCTVTDSEWIIRNRQPLAAYFPETVAIDLCRYPADGDLDEAMRQAGFAAVTRERVEFPYELTDVGPYRERVFSCLRLIPEEAFRAGLERMESDLGKGPIACISRYELVWGTKEGLG